MSQLEFEIKEEAYAEQQFLEQLDEDFAYQFSPGRAAFRGFPTLSHYDGDIVEDLD